MMTLVDRESFIAGMVAWLNRRFAPPGVTITATTPLFDDHLIDSVRILDLIAWAERAIDRRIPDEQILMNNFRTVERIAERFGREECDVVD